MLQRALAKFGGWFNTVLGIALLLLRGWAVGTTFLLLGLFLLTVGYRVFAIFGVRLPWVREDGN